MRRWHILDLIALLLLLGAASPLARLVYREHREAALPIDALSVMLPLHGFHEAEPLPDRAASYRWTTARATMQLPNPGGDGQLRLDLASGTDSATPVRIEIGASVYRFEIGPGLRSYSLLLPPQPGQRVTLAFESPTFTVRGRDLGVIVSRARIGGGGAVPGEIVLALTVGALGGYLLLRQAGLRLVTAALAILAIMVLALCWQDAGGWRFGLFTPVLLLAGGASLAAVIYERLVPPLALPPPSPTRLGQPDWQALGALLALALAVCLPWLGAPDPVGDLELAARRMGRMWEGGGLAAAHTDGGDYMPLRIYILRALSFLVLPLGGAFYDPVPPITHVLIKLPSLLANLGSVALIFIWGRRWRSPRGAALIAALYALTPPVWSNVAWWGQVDVLLTCPMLLALALFDRAGGRWSWICWATALLIKPQGIILAPLMYVVTLRRHGCRGLAQGGALAAGLLIAAAAPIALAGQGEGLYQAAAGSVGRFPAVTARAYNLWWLISGGRGISDLTMAPFGLSYRGIGLLLIGAVAALVGLAMLRRSDGPARVDGAAVLALAFFTLPTQIHERYAFFALAFLALRIPSDRLALAPYLVLMAGATINILGAIGGFYPPAYFFIRRSPLPTIVAVTNLVVLGWLLVRLIKDLKEDGPGAGGARP